MTNIDPPAGLSGCFSRIIVGLCGLLDHYEARERTAGPFVFLIRELLHRRLDRFAALLARFRAGRLAVPHVPRPVRRSAPYDPAWNPVPGNPGWMWDLVPGVAEYIGLFESMLADPELVALIAAGPQAGCLLRPLWRMVSAEPLPAILRPPPRRRCSGAPPDGAAAGATLPDVLPDSRLAVSAAAVLPRVERRGFRLREVRRIAPLPKRGLLSPV